MTVIRLLLNDVENVLHLIRLIFKSDTVEEQNDKAVSDQIANIAIFGFCVRKGRNSGGASIFFQ